MSQKTLILGRNEWW